jgi:lipid-A-disaccharide synthase
MTKIYITAGEESGDILGADLMQSLKKKHPKAEFYGVGGTLMQEQGLRSLFPMSDLSVMGIIEVLPKLRHILKRISQTVDNITSIDPDIVITIDAPDFSFRVIDRVKKHITANHKAQSESTKFYHYVAPTVWAWREERAAKLSKLYDGVFCLFPMEPPYFEKEGMVATFIGHPAAYNAANVNDDLRERLNIQKNKTVIGLMFGSRLRELHHIGPVIRRAVRDALKDYTDAESVEVVAVTLPHLEKHVKNLCWGLPCKAHVVTDRNLKWQAFNTMDFAIATSGTIGLELSLAKVPHIIAYKANALTAAIIKRKVKISYAHLMNIILDKPVVPEFIQEKCKAELLADEFKMLLSDQAHKKAQTDAFKELISTLTLPDNALPSQRIVDALAIKA